MPKKKSAPKKIVKQALFRRFFSRLKLFAGKHRILAVLISVTLAWGLIWLGQVAVERYKFYQAEKQLDALTTDIQKTFDDKYNLEKERSCHYSSAKFSKGDLSCSIRFHAKIQSINSTDANIVTNKLKDAVEKNRNFSLKQTTHNDLPFTEYIYDEGSEGQFISIELTQKNYRPACIVSSTYQVYGSKNKKHVPGTTDHLIIGISCFGPAKLEYFSVKD